MKYATDHSAAIEARMKKLEEGDGEQEAAQADGRKQQQEEEKKAQV